MGSYTTVDINLLYTSLTKHNDGNQVQKLVEGTDTYDLKIPIVSYY